jgi:hypothetical protein
MPTIIDWDSTLPQSYIQSSFNHTPQGNVLRTNMDSGPAKVRRLFTAVPENYSGVMVMTSAQLTTFKTFFTTTLGYGINTFNFPDPFNLSSTIEVRFKIDSNASPYQVTPDADTLDWSITLNLESTP